MNQLAMNPQRKPNRGQAPTAALAFYDKLTHEKWLHELVEQIRATEDEEACRKLKEQLPFRCAHYYHFQDDHRAQNALDAQAFLFQTTVDIDDASVVEEAREKALALNEDTQSPWCGLLLHMEYSARHKLHIDLRMPLGLTVEETQRQYCEVLGVPFDEDCITPERMIYITDAASEIYRSPEWYQVLPDDELAARRKALTDRGLPIDGPKQKKRKAKTESTVATPVKMVDYDPEARMNGVLYRDIVQEWLRLNEEIQCFLVRENGILRPAQRHAVLIRLAPALRAICDNSPERVLEVMPRWGLPDSEVLSIVTDTFKYSLHASPIMNKAVRAVMESEVIGLGRLPEQELTVKSEESDTDTDQQTNSSLSTLHSSLSKLPKALKASLAGIPANMHFPVIAAVLPIAGALADDVEVEYCDGARQRLGLMSIILGDQASGKSVCKQVVDIWKRPLEREDADARRREDEWKQKKKNRKANEKIPDDPQVLIRVLPVTVSCSTLLKRLKNSRSHTLYSFGEELDTLRKTNGAGSWSSKYDIYRLAFDHGEWGQDYNSDQAESGVVNVAYNWTMLGTYGAMRKCFSKDNVENGLSSRILVAEMPDSAFAPMPHYGHRTLQHEQQIEGAAQKLREAHGFVDTPRLRKAIGEWVEAKRLEAMSDIDRVKDTYRKRAAVIGFRAGVICHLLSGDERESKATLQFATTIAELTLRGQMSVFGEALFNQLSEGQRKQRTDSNAPIFDRLPEEFTKADLRALKQGFASEGSLRTALYRWVKAGWAEKAGAARWRKTQCHSVTVSQ